MADKTFLPRIDPRATGLRIAMLREERGITVRQMQEYFGFTTGNAIYKWQNGQALPSTDNLLVLARLYNTTIDDLIVEASPKKTEPQSGKNQRPCKEPPGSVFLSANTALIGSAG